MSDTALAERWLYTTLAADAALGSVVSTRIYSSVAPQSSTLPCVVFQQQAARDVMGSGPYRYHSTMLYTVRVIDEAGGWGTVEASADRIDAVLHAASGTATGGTIVACVREQPFSMVESIDGRTFRHLGGIYRLWLQD